MPSASRKVVGPVLKPGRGSMTLHPGAARDELACYGWDSAVMLDSGGSSSATSTESGSTVPGGCST